MAEIKERLIYTAQEEQEIVNFTNIDDELFVGHHKGHTIYEDVDYIDEYGNVQTRKQPKVVPFDYPIEAGETKQFTKPQADHLAKHLVDKILLKQSNGNANIGDVKLRQPLLDRILGKVVTAPQVETKQEVATEEPQIAEPEFPEMPKEEVKEEPAINGVKCDVCGKVVKNEFALRMHKGRFHK